jgi:enolase
MSQISDIFARQILDSRGYPTVEVDMLLSSGVFARAAVPAGASTGIHEAIELRDADERYDGMGVSKAVRNVNEVIGPELMGMDADEQGEIDRTLVALDGTPNKGNLGANALLGVSLVVARAAANDHGLPLYQYLGGVDSIVMPVPMMNVINGGMHADNNIDIQEFMIVPCGARSFAEALAMGAGVYHALKEVLGDRKLTACVGDEDGYAPDLAATEQALQLILDAIDRAGYVAGRDVFLAFDTAASELFKDGRYVLEGEGKELDYAGLVDFYADLVSRYPVISIEDGLDQEDWEGWKYMTARLGGQVQLVGDDLFVTSADRLRRGGSEGAANAVIIKLNQIGTITETFEAVRVARRIHYTPIVSHRSGETEDAFISDFAVAVGAGLIKAGPPARGERMSKYNQLLRIEENLGDDSVFPGIAAFGVDERPPPANGDPAAGGQG